MNEKEFIDELKKINIYITKEQLAQLNKYYKLLIEWNNKINLTRIILKEDVFLKHFYDSLTIIKVIDLNKYDTLCDFGTGAGFPGMVLKILFPKLKITLVDSLNKRINFLNNVISELKLDNIETVHARVENYARENREKYDIVVARAVSSLNILLEYAIPLVKKDKFFVAMKANVEEELNNSENAIKKLSTKLIKKEEFLLPKENSIRNILIFQKQTETNKIYPRNTNEIKKKAL